MSAESVPDPVGALPEQNEHSDFFLNFPEETKPAAKPTKKTKKVAK